MMHRTFGLALAVIAIVACDDDLTHLRSAVERTQRVTTVDGGATPEVATDASGDDATEATVPADTAVDSTPADTATDSGDTTDTTDSVDTTDTTDTTDTQTDTTPALHPARYPADRVHSPLTPSVVARLREVAAIDPALQDDVFMKVGASTTVSASFFKCFAADDYDLGAHSSLASTLDFFLGGDADGGDPFARTSLAAKVGVSARWALAGDPTPLEAEYLALAPRYALVHYGTNDMGLGSTYASALFPFVDDLWTIVDDLLAWGVVPSLATILRRLDRPAADLWVPTYNAVIAGLAQGRQIPLVDLWRAYESLPGYGIASDGLHSSAAPEGACHLTPSGLEFGYNTRNLHMLTLLSRLEAALLDGEAADPAGPALEGIGTRDDPVLIDALPFNDLRSTTVAPSQELDRYSGCASSADESGPEVVYRLDVATPTRLRMTVHDRGLTDIDLHLLDDTASEAGCLARNHQIIEATLAPGVYYVVLDTFVDDGDPRAGEYLFSVVPCPPDDASCG